MRYLDAMPAGFTRNFVHDQFGEYVLQRHYSNEDGSRTLLINANGKTYFIRYNDFRFVSYKCTKKLELDKVYDKKWQKYMFNMLVEAGNEQLADLYADECTMRADEIKQQASENAAF